MTDLHGRLATGDVLIMDGGMGAELEARGVVMHDLAWSALANVEQPALVEDVHADFIRAGAEILVTNTFSAGPLALGPAGLWDRADAIQRGGVEAAVRARDRVGRPVVIAGSVSGMKTTSATAPLSSGYRRELLDRYRRQVRNLADAGADVLVLEMMMVPGWHEVMLEAASEADLPVWLGMSAGPSSADELGTFMYHDQSFEQALVAFLAWPVDAVLVMHTDAGDVDAALDIVERHWDGVTGVYPHYGHWDEPRFVPADFPVETFVERCASWRARGVGILGGCCGVGPQHIAALRARFPAS